jgi:hypothetical protein
MDTKNSMVRLKTLSTETAEAITEGLIALGYAVQVRGCGIGLSHVVCERQTSAELKSLLDGLYRDNERWTKP